MNSRANRKKQILISLALVCLALGGLMSPSLVYPDSTALSQAITTSTKNLETQNKTQSIPEVQNKTNTKHQVLIDESRGLSAFFMLGIIINIIMAVTFAWWFSREWRRSKQ